MIPPSAANERALSLALRWREAEGSRLTTTKCGPYGQPVEPIHFPPRPDAKTCLAHGAKAVAGVETSVIGFAKWTAEAAKPTVGGAKAAATLQKPAATLHKPAATLRKPAAAFPPLFIKNGPFTLKSSVSTPKTSFPPFWGAPKTVTDNYTDMQAFPVAHTVWTYRAIFLLNNVRVGVWSQSVSIAVQA